MTKLLQHSPTPLHVFRERSTLAVEIFFIVQWADDRKLILRRWFKKHRSKNVKMRCFSIMDWSTSNNFCTVSKNSNHFLDYWVHSGEFRSPFFCVNGRLRYVLSKPLSFYVEEHNVIEADRKELTPLFSSRILCILETTLKRLFWQSEESSLTFLVSSVVKGIFR